MYSSGRGNRHDLDWPVRSHRGHRLSREDNPEESTISIQRTPPETTIDYSVRHFHEQVACIKRGFVLVVGLTVQQPYRRQTPRGGRRSANMISHNRAQPDDIFVGKVDVWDGVDCDWISGFKSAWDMSDGKRRRPVFTLKFLSFDISWYYIFSTNLNS